MSAERISKDFYSNCFIEAIRAKIKDPRHVKIFICWSKYNEAPCPHIMWSDGKADYDFGTSDYIPIFFAWTIHRGHIRKRRLGSAQRYIQYRKRMYSKVRRFQKKYH